MSPQSLRSRNLGQFFLGVVYSDQVWTLENKPYRAILVYSGTKESLCNPKGPCTPYSIYFGLNAVPI